MPGFTKASQHCFPRSSDSRTKGSKAKQTSQIGSSSATKKQQQFYTMKAWPLTQLSQTSRAQERPFWSMIVPLLISFRLSSSVLLPKAITSMKAACVLRILSSLISQEHFQTALRAFLSQNQLRSINKDDFLETIQKTLPREVSFDFAIFIENWLKTTGVNTLEAKFDSSSEKISSIEIHQTSSRPDEPLRARKTSIGFFYSDKEPFVRDDIIIKPDSVTVIQLPTPIKTPKAVLLNLYDVDYCKVLLSEESASFLMENSDKITILIFRGVLYRTVFEMAFSSKINPVKAICLFKKAYDSEIHYTHLFHIRKFILKILAILPEKQQRRTAQKIFANFHSIFTKEKVSEVASFFEDLIGFAGSPSEVCALIGIIKEKEAIPKWLQWKLLAKVMENGLWKDEVQTFEKVLLGDQKTKESERYLILKNTAKESDKAVDAIYREILNPEASMDLSSQICQMRGINCKINSEKNKRVLELFWKDARKVFQMRSREFAKAFWKNMLPIHSYSPKELKLRLKSLELHAEMLPALKLAIQKRVTLINVALKTEKKYFQSPMPSSS